MELHSIINTKMRLVYTCGYAIRTSTMFINLVKSNRYLMNLRVITDSKKEPTPTTFETSSSSMMKSVKN